jgi:hypothetical protein
MMFRMRGRLNAAMPTICFLLALPVMSATALAQSPPGAPIPKDSALSDQKAGSVLIFNLYASSATAPENEDTRISITNTSADSAVVVRLIFVNGASGEVSNKFACLASSQTTTVFASNLDPGVTGYLIAVAVERQFGTPIGFNYLIGQADVKLASGHAARLNAVAIAALFGYISSQTPEDGAQLNFDGVSYNRIPRTLTLTGIPGYNDGNYTLLVINRLGGDLRKGGMATIGSVSGNIYDPVSNPFPFTFTAGCQVRGILSDIFPRMAPHFPQIIFPGTTGWMRFWSNSQDDSFSSGGRGVLGAAITFNSIPNRAFNGGVNLNAETLTKDTLLMSLIPPSC